MASLGRIVCKTLTQFQCNACRKRMFLVRREISSTQNIAYSYWFKVYHERKKHAKVCKAGLSEFGDILREFDYGIPRESHDKPNYQGVFVNNEINLQGIRVYGFDYDYTLASYRPELHHLLFDLGKKALIQRFNYPEGIAQKTFNPEFAMRGLHYDVRKGLLMKIDSYHHIQLGTVYRGTSQLSDTEVEELYRGTHVPLEDMNTFYGVGPMHQLVDMFAPPEINLITNVTDYFIENNIPYDPDNVFYDVRHAVQSIHTSGMLHQKILENLETYLDKTEGTKIFLERLVNAGKKLFIITNSGFPFVDAGMKYMIGSDWRDLFDVVVVAARKPKFFTDSSRPFRQQDENHRNTWDRVKTLEKGLVYSQGNFRDFRHMTGWYGSKCLYFGDHVYSDLADPSLKHGWRTGALIPELETEIETISTPEFREAVQWLTVLQHLLEEMQEIGSQESLEMIPKLLQEREELRNYLKSLCNPKFGSMFRTHHNPTYFTRRLNRFADIYMSKLTNLLQYSADHTFYPRRTALPHEPHTFGDPTHLECTRQG